MADTPNKIRLHIYHVGFGDAFLLSFDYQNRPSKHVLIDLGTTAYPKVGGRPKKRLVDVAQLIKEHSDQKLDAVIATHRHADHIRGFGGTSGDVIASLQPTICSQPWTEDPDLSPNATRPLRIRQKDQAFVASLAKMETVVSAVGDEIKRRRVVGLDSPRGQLGFLGETNIANRVAVDGLIELGRIGTPEYLSHGSESLISQEIPGVKLHVLGPPTIEEAAAILSQRSRDVGEYWHLAARGRQRAALADVMVSGGKALRTMPLAARWFVDGLDQLRGQQLLEIVRAVDHALNNTSLILLFEVGTGSSRRLLLFPGDAQIENWEYALFGPDHSRWKSLLRKVDLYKVGHHGSLNATPKTLWSWFDKRNPNSDPNRLRTVMSTLGNKHGSRYRETEVPRRPLVDALQAESDHTTTQDFSSKKYFDVIEL